MADWKDLSDDDLLAVAHRLTFELNQAILAASNRGIKTEATLDLTNRNERGQFEVPVVEVRFWREFQVSKEALERVAQPSKREGAHAPQTKASPQRGAADAADVKPPDECNVGDYTSVEMLEAVGAKVITGVNEPPVWAYGATQYKCQRPGDKNSFQRIK